MKISAIFDSVDHAEIAVHHLKDAGVQIHDRKVTDLASHGVENNLLPTDQFYFPASAEFYSGMADVPSFFSPSAPFFSMTGNSVGNFYPYGGEARLIIEVDAAEEKRVQEMLLGMHGTGIHSYQ